MKFLVLLLFLRFNSQQKDEIEHVYQAQEAGREEYHEALAKKLRLLQKEKHSAPEVKVEPAETKLGPVVVKSEPAEAEAEYIRQDDQTSSQSPYSLLSDTLEEGSIKRGCHLCCFTRRT